MKPNSSLIIIPAFNEDMNIAGVLSEILALSPEADILVVNDGSSDRRKSVV